MTVLRGDCVELMRRMPENSVDSIVTDPPYGLEFMGKDWDAPWKAGEVVTVTDEATNGTFHTKGFKHGVRYSRGRQEMLAFQEWFEIVAVEALRVLKPGGHLLAFGGTRTYHRMVCAIEDAGFEIRDSIHWHYASGFPKSLNVKKSAKDKCCQCEQPVPYIHGDADLFGVRDRVSDARGVGEARQESDVQPSVQREGSRQGTGEARAQGARGVDGGISPFVSGEDVRPKQSGVEGRGDVQASEGELRRATVRPVSSGVPADGPEGRVHHGASAGDGAVGGTNARPDGSGESSEPRPARQPAGESGVVPDQRGPQAWGGWPVCQRCEKPILPEGLGTALKPAHEPIVVARKPLQGTVAGNVLVWGTGGLNIDGCRVGAPSEVRPQVRATTDAGGGSWSKGDHVPFHYPPDGGGRWPANVVFDRTAGEALDQQSGDRPGMQRTTLRRGATTGRSLGGEFVYGTGQPLHVSEQGYGDSGGASRFFTQADFGPDDWPFVYQAKPSRRERNAGLDGLPEQRPDQRTTTGMGTFEEKGVAKQSNHHPTVKPVALMRHLVRLVTPPGGTVLDPFAGSGTTLVAAILEGLEPLGCEMTDEYLPIIEGRMAWAHEQVAARVEAEANPAQPTLL